MWHFDGHTDSFFARSLDTTEPRWSVLVTGDWSAYCGANCWRSDVIGSNKISHTHTLINIPSHHSHTHTGSNPVFSCEMECDPLHILTLFILISCFIPHILHSTWYSNYSDTPLLCSLVRGQSTLAPSRWYNNGTRWQCSGHWTLDWRVWWYSCNMHLFIMHCVHHWKMSRVNFVKKVVWSLVVVFVLENINYVCIENPPFNYGKMQTRIK